MKYEGCVYYEFYDGSIGAIDYIEGRLGYQKVLSHIRELAHKKRTFITCLRVR